MKFLTQLASKRQLLFALALFALVIVYSILAGTNLVEVTFGQTQVDIEADRYIMSIPYDMVESVELVEMPEKGDNTNGWDDMTVRCGTWVNDTWGQYEVCADLAAKNAVVVHLNDGRIFVFSRRSNQVTEELFAELNRHLQ